MSVLLLQGNARQIPLRDGSVHCVVTSPPYYGLRDYQTGQWVGGEADCEHRSPTMRTGRNEDRPMLAGSPATNAAQLLLMHQQPCGRCGAVRVDQQIGLERSPDCGAWARQEPPCAGGCWVCAMRVVFKEVWRILVPTGVCFINVGDSYARSGSAPPRRDHSQGQGLGTYGQQGYSAACAMPARRPGPLPEKNLLGMPWRLALALQADGFILRSEIIWHKVNPMPESVFDRPTRAHEQVFLFSKQGRYFYDAETVREPGSPNTHARFGNGGAPRQNGSKWAESHGGSQVNTWMLEQVAGRACRSVWSLASEPCHFAHFATFPTELVRKCLLAGAPTQVCAQCQAPWVRQVEREIPHDSGRGLSAKYRQNGAFRGDTTRRLGRHYQDQLSTHPPQTLGFLPTCACAAPTKPCTVLDPFVGSGTVLQVARELGLHGIGVDLSWEYVKNIARERLGLADLHRWSHGATPQPVSYTDLPLFAEDLRCR